ncbi:MAG TPA: DnaJ C-terminal domain-containing protein [Phenylobacterium sp.]|uniref:DnaJ C-terminal domain-containing protein n=1 Tax=Phenylobacterium sp. TaxID=1871053 RepID=UPI002BC463F2|nr:DnaJ C-terminal domain-containing protein [Phenylobacterium sp.]HSV04085.1 DnaJ C-terminal domain-containing protein [Phenylobacterium sp.]
MSLSEARALLGVGAAADAQDVRRAFRSAAKSAHPDRTGGPAEPFQRLVEACRRLERATGIAWADPLPPKDEPGKLYVSPLVAWGGGWAEHRTPDGRKLRIRCPVGLRSGDEVRAEGVVLEVTVRNGPDMQVRGHDLWMTVAVPPETLAGGGRLAVVTPIGRRVLWVSKRAGERRLLRAPGLGLPARGRHPEGHLFVRLAPKAGPLDSAARALLKRFSAAWAA